MSYVSNQAYIANKINNLKLKLTGDEPAEGALDAQNWVTAIIKVAVIFIIGIVILQGVTDNTGLNNTSAPFYSLAQSVQSNITSGYSLASLVVLVVGAGAVIHFFGFV